MESSDYKYRGQPITCSKKSSKIYELKEKTRNMELDSLDSKGLVS
jgi:hypothetical protein